jgi:hypothetical protein
VRLRTRIRLVQLAATLALLAVAVGVGVASPPSLTLIPLLAAVGPYLLIAPVLVWLASGWLLRRVLVARASTRLAQMVARGETRESERLLYEIEEVQGANGAATIALHRAALLCAEGRFRDAWSVLDPIDVGGSPLAPYVANLRAWVLAIDGHPAQARALLSHAMAGARVPVRLRAMMRGTYGVACVLDGMPAEGQPALEEAIRDGDARSRATWSYFLGEAMHARGDDETAAQAYQAALEVEDRGALAARAREQLRRLALGAMPYR